MRIYPVLDLRGGRIVHAVAGRRHRYAPIRSSLTDSSAPLAVARALRSSLGLRRLYVADLDALVRGAEPDWTTIELLATDAFDLLIDAAVRDVARARRLESAGASEIVVALESLGSPSDLDEVLAKVGPERTVFSLDLQGGRPVGGPPAWQSLSPPEIVDEVVRIGACRILLLDLAAVGTGAGWPLECLAREALANHPGLELLSGGGVRGPRDLEALSRCGVRGALVATALHDGSLGRRDLATASEG